MHGRWRQRRGTRTWTWRRSANVQRRKFVPLSLGRGLGVAHQPLHVPLLNQRGIVVIFLTGVAVGRTVGHWLRLQLAVVLDAAERAGVDAFDVAAAYNVTDSSPRRGHHVLVTVVTSAGAVPILL